MGTTICEAERRAWLTLALVPGLGPARLGLLREAYGTLSAVLEAPAAAAAAIPALSPDMVRPIQEAPARAEAVLREAASHGATVLVPGDPGFPGPLASIPTPPALLFAIGDPALAAGEAVAIVGARRHTGYGATVCRRVAAASATGGLVVVSGMARGLDAIAHQAALDAGGRSVGVLGNGVGVVYPASNRRLYEAMAHRGLLLTEFLPGERPGEGSFQRRNRLISGLARVTVVIEAGSQSGTLITAGTAMEQNRDVMVVPGPITSDASVGANRLLRDGALPLLEMEDLWARYPGYPRHGSGDAPAGGSPIQQRVLHALRQGPLHADELARRLGADIGDTLGLLAAMEVQDLVRQEPGLVFSLPVAVLAAEQAAGPG